MEPKKLKMDPSAIVSSAIEYVSSAIVEHVPSAIVGEVAGQSTQSVMTWAWNQIGNVKNCQEYIINLQEVIDKFIDCRKRIEGRVERARNNGEIVEDDVLKWLTKAHAMETEVEEFLKCKPGENKRLFSASVEKYDMGKEAKKKTQSVLGLMEEVGNFTEVSHPPPPPDFESSSSNDYEIFQSRAPVFQEIMAALKDDEIKMIGVYGMGGVGKTRMVEEVGEQAKKDSLFDKVVITTISQSLNLRNVQGELADRLGLTLNKETEVGRASQLCNRLKNGKKTLVIIDDVWKDINLKEIGIPIPLGDGCKIVLTSRSQGVCTQMMVQKDFEIGVLSDDEAWALFQTKVGNSMISSQDDMRSVAEKVCRECGGLPVALLAVGAVLMKYKNKQYAWDDVLEQLINSRLNKVDGLKEDVYSRLELSYDYLQQTDAKKCFLICCLFGEDAQISIEDLLEYGMGMRLFGNVGTIEKARNRVKTLVDNLKISCLLLQGRWGRDYVKMHDVVRDVAISIASKNRQAYLVRTGINEWPEMDKDEHYTSISLWSTHIRKLPNGLEYPNLRVLVLEWYYKTSTEIPPSFFKGMEKLEVLVLRNMSITSPESSISCLANLRMLRIHSCNLVNISFLKGLKGLEKLSLGGSEIKEFGLEEIGELTRLRRLDLNLYDEGLSADSKLGIIPTHVISNLSLLEELYIHNMFADSKVELEATDKDRCNTSLSVTFSKDRLFEKLTRFIVFIGDLVLSSNPTTRILSICGTDPLEHWVQVLLLKAETLELRRLHDLNNVFHDRDGKGFLDLKHLHIDECHHDREYILGEQKCVHFSKLSTLIITRCHGLKHTVSPSNARGLVQLDFLGIENCKSMDRIIGNEEHDNFEEVVNLVTFHQLRRIVLSSLPNLISFYPKLKYMSTHEQNQSFHIQPLFNEKVAFPALEKLQVQRLKMKDIWQKKLPNDSFCHLKKLLVYSCHNLGNAFSSSTAKSLVHLKELRVVSCKKMEEIVTIEEEGTEKMDKIVFHQLAVLELINLPALECFCSSRSVEEGLVAGEMVPQRALFSDEVAFPCLKKLRIERLSKLTEIWQSNVLVELRARFPTLRYCKVEDFEDGDFKDEDSKDEDFVDKRFEYFGEFEDFEDEDEVEDFED